MKKRSPRTPSLRALRGVTLFEVLIVVAILAMVAGGVAVAALQYQAKARESTARTEAHHIRSVAALWLSDRPEHCPTFADLVEERLLDRGGRQSDPWGSRYQIECEGVEVVVVSAGPDRRAGTEDDIRVPPPGTG